MDVTITKIKGLDKEVYTTIAPIAMSKKGMKYFDMYPVITSEDHTWYVVKDAENFVCAFIAVVCNKNVYSLREFYIAEECPRVQTFTTLLDAVMKDIYENEYDVSAYTKAEYYELWKRYKFEATKRGKNWYTLRREAK